MSWRPWDPHPPWAHWGFFAVWVVAGTLGPITLVVALINGHAVWIGVALCCIWMLDLLVDWLMVQHLKTRDPDWTPWAPPSWWAS